MQTLIYPDKRLTKVSTEVTTFDEELETFANQLTTHCLKSFGLGMAAPQVGKHIRLIVVCKNDKIADDCPTILVNPKIENATGLSRYKEGCLSVPGIFAWVERPATFTVTYQDLQGGSHEYHVKNANDELFGTVVQHEVDHLNGIEFVDLLTDYEYNKIVTKLNKLRKKKRRR